MNIKKIKTNIFLIFEIARQMPGAWFLILLQLLSGVASIIGLPLLVPVLHMLSNDSAELISPLINTLTIFASSIGIETNFYLILLLTTIFIITSILFDISVVLIGQFRQYDLAAKSSLSLLNNYINVKWPWMVKHHSGEVNHALYIESAQWSEAIYQSIRLITTIIQLSVYLLLTFLIHFEGALFALLAICLLVIVNVLISQTIKSISYKKNLEQKYYSEFIQSMQQNRKLIKSSIILIPLKYEFTRLINNIISYAKRMALRNQTQSGISQSGILLILVMLLALHSQFNLVFAELVVMMAIFARILPQVSMLSASYASFATVLPVHQAFTKRLDLLIKEREIYGEKKVLSDVKIKFEKVYFSYPNGKVVLSHADMEIEPNKTTVIIGESGEGKSTILDLLLGLLRPDNGKILYGNFDDNKINYRHFRSQVAYVSQETTLFPGTIMENLSFNKKLKNNELLEVLNILKLEEIIKKNADGLNTIIGENGIRLSGGQRQRLAIARALLMKPKILLFDEATSALDKNTEDEILKSIFKNFNHKLTMIIVSHTESVNKYADQIYKLSKGKLKKI